MNMCYSTDIPLVERLFVLLFSDVDECKEDTKLCEVNEFCQNLLGNYSCVCTAGYRWNSITGKCEKIGV